MFAFIVRRLLVWREENDHTNWRQCRVVPGHRRLREVKSHSLRFPPTSEIRLPFGCSPGGEKKKEHNINKSEKMS